MDLAWSIFLAVLVADALAILGVYMFVHYRRGADIPDILKALWVWTRLLVRHYVRIWASLIFFGLVIFLTYDLVREFFF